jgi:hypothetical protein
MRIADAVEKMAVRHTELIDDRERFKRWYMQRAERVKLLERRCAAYKGIVKRLKKQPLTTGRQGGNG